MRRLLLIEAEKLIRSSVFWVAPIVLIFYLGLMLFGYEVYAAKNGVDRSSVPSTSKQMTGSAVVSVYTAVQRMAKNVISLFIFPDNPLGDEKKKIIDDELVLKPGTVEEFDYWGTFFEGLTNPKPIPKPQYGSPCECKDEDAREGVLFPWSFFIGEAYAGDIKSLKPPPRIKKSDSFVERVQKRMYWLTEPVGLENMLIDRSRFNGLRFTYISLYFAFVFVFPLITISVAAQMFAGEFSNGAIRTCLLRPVKRSQFLLAKLMVLGGYLVLLVIFFIVCSLVLGTIFSGYGNLVLDSELLGNVGKDRLILADGAVMMFFISAPVVAVSFFPLAALGILISYLKPEPSTVIGIAAIVYFILFALGDLPLFEDIKFLFFTTYMDVWTYIFETPFPAEPFVEKLAVLALMTAGVLLAVGYISAKKDILV